MHIPIVVSLLAILVAMVPSAGVSLIATRGRKSSGGNDEPDEANVGSDRGSQARKSSSEADTLDSPLQLVVRSSS
jgi:hypothetical protein